MPTKIDFDLNLPNVSAARPVQSTASTQMEAKLTLKMVRTLAGSMDKGESGKAEVLAIKEGMENNFRLLLKLTLINSGQSLVEVESSRPLVPGNLLNIRTVNNNVLGTLLNNTAGNQPLTTLNLKQLPPGTLLQGKVLSSTPLPTEHNQQVVHRILLNLLNTSLVGSRLSIDSLLPLAAGSLLTTLVKDSQQLVFLPPQRTPRPVGPESAVSQPKHPPVFP